MRDSVTNSLGRIGFAMVFGFGSIADLSFGQEPSVPTDFRLSPSFQTEDGESTTGSSQLPDSHVEQKGEWEFELAPYLWASSLRADASIGPISSTSEACFTDLLKNLDFGGMLRFEGLHDDRWGFYLDGTYMKLGDDARAKIGPFRFRGIEVDAQFTQAWLDFGGMYRFGKQGRSFDLMLGGRYSYLSTDVSVGPFLDLDSSKDFVSPVVGGRVQYRLTEKWLVSLKGDVGGFGVGNAADLVWGATALFGYRFSDRTTLGFGYRYYDIDLSSGRLDADVQMYGPIVGVAYRF